VLLGDGQVLRHFPGHSLECHEHQSDLRALTASDLSGSKCETVGDPFAK
jgi:hypothetical protein